MKMNERTFTLAASDLTVGYGKKPVVSEASFGVRAGEILTLIGPNGAGKSTLLRSITGQLTPLGGTVLLEQQDMRAYRHNALAKKLSILMTGQMHTELMTCRDVVATGRYPYTGPMGLLSDADRETVRESMALVGVLGLAQRDFTRISDGQRQMVLLARAICQQPEVLVLDEPTSYLDIRHKLELMDVLKRLVRQKNIAVIQALHELDLAQKCSDRLLCIRDGRVDRAGSPEEIFSGHYIETLYGVSAGTFSNLYGTPELPGPQGTPQVFVIGGAGAGIPVYRQLQRQGRPFSAGILWENDLDYPVAAALAAETVVCAFGGTMDAELIRRAKQMIDATEYTRCPLPETRMTGGAAGLLELKRYAESCGKLRPEEGKHGL